MSLDVHENQFSGALPNNFDGFLNNNSVILNALNQRSEAICVAKNYTFSRTQIEKTSTATFHAIKTMFSIALRYAPRSQPRESVDAATARLKSCKTIDSEITEFFRERCAIEVAYHRSLEQLSKKTLSVPNVELGGFVNVWNKLLGSIAEEAQFHKNLALDLSDKVVGPMTSRMENDKDWRQVRTHEVELGKLLKSYEDEVKGLKKDGKTAIGGLLKTFNKKKPEDTSPEVSAGIEIANKSFENKAGPILQKFERMDKSRKRALNTSLSHYYGDVFDNIAFSPRKINDEPQQTITASPPANVDSEGFTIVPESTNFALDAKNTDFDSSDDENVIIEAPKIKVAINSDIIRDENSALNLKILAPALPASRRKTQNRQTILEYPVIEPIPALSSVNVPTNPFSTALTPSKAVIKLQGNITETVNVLIRDGTIEKLLLTGEISITIPPSTAATPDSRFKLTILGTDAFEKFVVNESCATVFTGMEGNGLDIDLAKLGSVPNSHIVAKYQVRVPDDEIDFYAPILANPLWKCESHSTSLLLPYEYNTDLIRRLNVADLKILATLTDGGDLKSTQMKPDGVWNPERRSILWDVGNFKDPSNPASNPTTVAGSIRSDRSSVISQDPFKVIARIETTSQATPGTIAIHFKAGGLLSGIDVDITDHNDIILNEVSKSTVSGKYACVP
ncbi:hypothetical protein HK100_002071 [Physocladia obscura]|uniref:MHD domain-containing protein n=1 Tax=Physocladia obscura TaxID=109957 RepID=A0AAD5T8Y7_9FUNG|nr:hypothetical protein HK100_002071 [Physocladia obscura]